MFHKSALLLTGALFWVSNAALAGSNTSSHTDLPGVAGDYRIVKPFEAEPDDTALQDKAGQFKIGNVDVRISGDVTIDIGVGSTRPPRH